MTDAESPELIPVEVDAELAAVVAAHPLPAGVLDADFDQGELAAALGTTVNTVAKWIRDGMPVAQAGGNGRAYVLRLSHCYAWRSARDAEAASRDRHNRAQVEALQASFLGLDLDNKTASLSASERKALAEADIAHSRAAHMRRQLVPLTEVRDLLESLCKTVRDGLENMPDRLERELGLRSEQVRNARQIGRDILTRIADQIDEAELRDRDVPDVGVEDRWVI